MKHIVLLIVLILLGCTTVFAAARKGKGGTMERKSFDLLNCRIAAGMDWNTIPSDSLFAGKGKPLTLGKSPRDFSAFAGSKVDRTKCIMIRGEVNLPEAGFYTVNAGADWWFKIAIDGKTVLDACGFSSPVREEDYTVPVKLTAGKHIVDIHLSRGNEAAALAFALRYWGKEVSSVDLTNVTGKIRKELHGCNTTLSLSSRAGSKYEDALKKLNFTMTRTHDWALWNSGQRIIDTHFIFPLMNLDPKDPANYYFDASDEIIRLTQEVAGLEVFYRLGSSIEHSGEKHFNVIPPADPAKYAEVLAGIVRHYTRGWAKGYHYKIRYWEIWNEPDGFKNMWPAQFETFVPFFVTVLKRLKSEFPELQFGGPALGQLNEERFKKLLNACKAAGVAPDFISWHCYSRLVNPKLLIRQPYDARKMLDDMGFTKTKLCINEWHYIENWDGIRSSASPEKYRKALASLQGINSGVYNLAVLIGWQDSPLDLAMWYGSSWDSPAWGYRNGFHEFTKNYYSMELFGRFIREYPVKCQSDDLAHYTLAARSEDGSKAGILIADYKGTGDTVEVTVRGIEKYSKISAVVLDEERNNAEIPVNVKDGRIILKKKKSGSAAFMVRLEK